MQASSLGSLEHKKRSISDLARSIQTRADSNPNYSLLLGAGCSASSGIRSGQRLVNDWRREIFDSGNPNQKNASDDVVLEYLVRQNSWYDQRNEYACLFEKRFELPRLRRAFVENEVKEKNPSIGYGYLTGLVDQSYFKTIFTTNFDDLINEAFHRFSESRPIVCAHDSSIHSITVTSVRPKIIKLHGDYLFDDIKSTLRETETLEQNMKEKFTEFAKDFGLIVVGYSGSDRSVMDNLNMLLRQENYFKCGLYWCIQRGSDVSPEVQKILWHDKVYFVEIDGFDQLFAELNRYLNGHNLPFELNYISEKPESIVRGFIKDLEDSQIKSEVITEDLEKLKSFSQSRLKTREGNEFGLENSLNSSSGSGTEETFRNVDQTSGRPVVQVAFEMKALELLSRHQFSRALEYLEAEIAKTSDEEWKEELLNLVLRCNLNLGERLGCRKTYDRLRKVDPTEPAYFFRALPFEDSYEKKMELIQAGIVLDPYRPTGYTRKALLQKARLKDHYVQTDSRPSKEQITDLLQMALNLMPTPTNAAFDATVSFVLENESSKERASAMCDEKIGAICKHFEFHPDVVWAKCRIMKEKGVSKEKVDEYFKSIEKSVSSAYARNLAWRKVDIDDLFADKVALKLSMSDFEVKYGTNGDYLMEKSGHLLKHFDDLSGAISSQAASLAEQWNIATLRRLLILKLYDGRLDEVEKEMTQLGGELSEFKVGYFEAQGELVRALEQYRSNSIALGMAESPERVNHEVFLLLKLGKYVEAEMTARKTLEKIAYGDPILVANLELAKKLNSKKVNADRLNKFIGLNGNKTIKAGMYALLGDKKSCLTTLKEAIEEDFEEKYRIRDWIVFHELKNDPAFLEISRCTYVVAEEDSQG